jgi:hypothetical protein
MAALKPARTLDDLSRMENGHAGPPDRAATNRSAPITARERQALPDLAPLEKAAVSITL